VQSLWREKWSIIGTRKIDVKYIDNEGIREWIWCKYCVHMNVKAKKIPVETISWMGGAE
jgi:hypothetical protein